MLIPEHRMSLYQVENTKNATASGSTLTPAACDTYPLCSNKVCDRSLSIKERVAGLVDSMTTQEKIYNLVDAAAGSTRLGLPSYEYWSEATHG